MKFASLLLSVCLALLIWPQPATTQSQEKPVDLAQKSAETWLALADAGKYPETWDEGSALMKSAITKDRWTVLLKSARDPLGALKSRKLKSATYTKSLPGAPEGEYVVIQYEASFANMPSAIETITPMLDKDGKWRVSGYYIKPAS